MLLISVASLAHSATRLCCNIQLNETILCVSVCFVSVLSMEVAQQQRRERCKTIYAKRTFPGAASPRFTHYHNAFRTARARAFRDRELRSRIRPSSARSRNFLFLSIAQRANATAVRCGLRCAHVASSNPKHARARARHEHEPPRNTRARTYKNPLICGAITHAQVIEFHTHTHRIKATDCTRLHTRF